MADDDGIYPLWDGERVNASVATRWLSWEFGAGVSYVPFEVGSGCYSVAAFVAVGPWSLSVDVKVADLLADLRER